MQGVTLIKLMIVITILGVLAVVAAPAYRGYSERAPRLDAMNALEEIARSQKTQFLRNNTFTGNFNALGFPGGVTEDGRYLLSFDGAPDRTGYIARAVPAVGGGQEEDKACQWFTLDARGVKASGPDIDCW